MSYRDVWLEPRTPTELSTMDPSLHKKMFFYGYMVPFAFLVGFFATQFISQLLLGRSLLP